METTTIELDFPEGGDLISANEKPLTSKAVMTIFDKMSSKDDRTALSAAEAALRIYGKDQPVKKEAALPFLACFSNPAQLANLLQGLMGLAELAPPSPEETPAALEASDVNVEIVE